MIKREREREEEEEKERDGIIIRICLGNTYFRSSEKLKQKRSRRCFFGVVQRRCSERTAVASIASV